MRKKADKAFAAVVIAAAMLGQAVPAAAEQQIVSQERFQEPVEIETTAYCDYGITASGCMVREGICAAQEKLMGKCAILYRMNEDGTLGDFLGYYEILDTGGDYRIQNGTVIDIYLPDYDQCIEYGRQKAYVQIVDAEG